ncbi:GNAT family N-acetyltransferase [Enterovibrio sp. ZSDZ42]|uniref:tRNA(Met) cytidine acetyltransferase TmcA n=1 Tax=Enterovibrio gelatinilyticus TaxID=2899819 RepID=A0ABT5R7K0_9GAMM|nr:GNAT family N-acetyltransferase [Enterovibrio sp. ZSDZ42]MDD1795746.1 GNAT family N-acetyltransferase [Enterovibrio sp. ZSDZ42]
MITIGDPVLSDPISALRQLHQMAKRGNVRVPVFIRGDRDFSFRLVSAVPGISVVTDDSSVFDEATFPRLKWNDAKQLLGQEIGSLALDVREHIDVEKLCAISGCIRGGELLFFLVNNEEEPLSGFRQRFIDFSSHANAAMFCQSGLFWLPKASISDTENVVQRETTLGQDTAIDAIERVLLGHRRRPALLVADRGRGKSSAMGLAAAKIMQTAKKRLIVTSPTVANVDILLQHAASVGGISREGKYGLKSDNGSELVFVAPDALLLNRPECDLLLVDEAAAIPLPMLDACLERYSRVVFSTTEHGYEGTGRSFSIRFRQLLDERTKGWKEVRLKQPIRWSENDLLEQWLFDTFLFDAEPNSAIANEETNLRFIAQHELLNDESLLRQVFALLVSAHYQTSPNDLVQLLDGRNQSLITAFKGETLVGVALAQQEGGFDKDLAKAVVAGKRRVKGHLLAQSLATHTGIIDPLLTPLLRITRIAVLDKVRHCGIGRSLLVAMECLARENNIATIGTSYGVNSELFQFWSSLAYLPVRLGVSRDAASGTYSLQMAKALSTTECWLSNANTLFGLNFTLQLHEQYKAMNPYLIAQLLYRIPCIETPCLLAKKQVSLFAEGILGYDLVTGSLWRWFVHWLSLNNAFFNQDRACTALIERVVKRRSWQDVARDCNYQGRKETESAIRLWVSEQLANEKELE